MILMSHCKNTQFFLFQHRRMKLVGTSATTDDRLHIAVVPDFVIQTNTSAHKKRLPRDSKT